MEINSLSKLSFDRDRTVRIVTKQNIFIWPPTVSIVEKDVADTKAIGGMKGYKIRFVFVGDGKEDISSKEEFLF